MDIVVIPPARKLAKPVISRVIWELVPIYQMVKIRIMNVAQLNVEQAIVMATELAGGILPENITVPYVKLARVRHRHLA